MNTTTVSTTSKADTLHIEFCGKKYTCFKHYFKANNSPTIFYSNFNVIICLLAFIVAILWTTPSKAIPVLQYDMGEVTGVNGVEVAGIDWLIEFRDGSFIELFPNGIDPFFFQNLQNLHIASDQIEVAFLDDPSIIYAEQIRGCESYEDAPDGTPPPQPLHYCNIFFPWNYSIGIGKIFPELAVLTIYADGDFGDVFCHVTDATLDLTRDLSNAPCGVYAVPKRVHETFPLCLLIVGLMCLAFFSKHKIYSVTNKYSSHCIIQ